jgi:hypothetical protein
MQSNVARLSPSHNTEENLMKYFGPAENWFWVWRCDDEGRHPDVLRVLMWVITRGEIIGMVNNPQRPGWIMEPVFIGIYKHFNDLAPDELEIVNTFRKHGLTV